MKRRNFNIIVAIDAQNGIGKEGKIPWKLTQDLAHFKMITSQTESPFKSNAVIMGRKTWESIPEKFKPLVDRINIVLTRNNELVVPASVIKSSSLENAFVYVREHEDEIEKVFVIGGQQLYEQALQIQGCRYLYLTQLSKSFNCDTFFPSFEEFFKRVSSSDYLEENMIMYNFSKYERI